MNSPRAMYLNLNAERSARCDNGMMARREPRLLNPLIIPVVVEVKWNLRSRVEYEVLTKPTKKKKKKNLHPKISENLS